MKDPAEFDDFGQDLTAVGLNSTPGIKSNGTSAVGPNDPARLQTQPTSAVRDSAAVETKPEPAPKSNMGPATEFEEYDDEGTTDNELVAAVLGVKAELSIIVFLLGCCMVLITVFGLATLWVVKSIWGH